jgi:hypothetical protein
VLKVLGSFVIERLDIADPPVLWKYPDPIMTAVHH